VSGNKHEILYFCTASTGSIASKTKAAPNAACDLGTTTQPKSISILTRYIPYCIVK
jgi:hypothetical protein